MTVIIVIFVIIWKHGWLAIVSYYANKKKASVLEAFSLSEVEVTGLEPATAWSQTRNATNCATPRICGCKGTHFLRPLQTFPQFILGFT